MDNITKSDIEFFFDRAKMYIKDIKKIRKAIRVTSLRVLNPINKRLIEKYIDTVEAMQETLFTGGITTEYLIEHKEEFDADNQNLARAVNTAIIVKNNYILKQELDKSLYELIRETDKFRTVFKYSKKTNKQSFKNMARRKAKAAKEVKKFNKKNPGALEEFEMTLEEVPCEMQEAMLEENPEMYRMMLLNIIAGRHKSE